MGRKVLKLIKEHTKYLQIGRRTDLALAQNQLELAQEIAKLFAIPDIINQREMNIKKTIIDYTKELAFWERLKSFVSDVQTGCYAGEEEKEMILFACKEKINKFTNKDKISEFHKQ